MPGIIDPLVEVTRHLWAQFALPSVGGLTTSGLFSACRKVARSVRPLIFSGSACSGSGTGLGLRLMGWLLLLSADTVRHPCGSCGQRSCLVSVPADRPSKPDRDARQPRQTPPREPSNPWRSCLYSFAFPPVGCDGFGYLKPQGIKDG